MCVCVCVCVCVHVCMCVCVSIVCMCVCVSVCVCVCTCFWKLALRIDTVLINKHLHFSSNRYMELNFFKTIKYPGSTINQPACMKWSMNQWSPHSWWLQTHIRWLNSLDQLYSYQLHWWNVHRWWTPFFHPIDWLNPPCWVWLTVILLQYVVQWYPIKSHEKSH